MIMAERWAYFSRHSNINCGVYYCWTAIAEFGGIGDDFEEEKKMRKEEQQK